MKRVNNPAWETEDGLMFDTKKEAMMHEAILEMAVLVRDDISIDTGTVVAARKILENSNEWMRALSLMRRRAK